MMGKGSVNHNSRKFHAENTDPERAYLNQSYCNESIKKVYHELFEEALKKHNTEQTRSDRCIDDYYEKIRTGKQEKPFKEIILQIGNLKDMNAKSENGQLAAKVLEEYMQDFQNRNPNMRVFSAHLHMDEATPHLHIDFVPFTTGSNRGLETRVSLKQALATQGFRGGSKMETEWNQWVQSEKEQLAVVMERHGIEWENLGTHEPHLSVYNYEKQEREKEVSQLGTEISESLMAIDLLKEKKEGALYEIKDTEASLNEVKGRLENLQDMELLIGSNMEKYDKNPEWQVPDPGTLMSAKTYKTKVIIPFVAKLKEVIRKVIAQYLSLSKSFQEQRNALFSSNEKIEYLNDRVENYHDENSRLKGVENNFERLKKFLGKDRTEQIIREAKAQENPIVPPKYKKQDYER